MNWTLNEKNPVYMQIIRHIQNDIVSGVYAPGQKLPSVRELALIADVNPNTMQKALSELESTGLVHSKTTCGRFITEDTHMIENLKESLATSIATEFIEKLKEIGFTDKEIKNLLNTTLENSKCEEKTV
ncbi:MAG: GntR family transcriptional regulator [Butyrivibrio sp.]|nr:GntR family transcriptional regulator [Butyrivibrio sp.]